MYDFGYIYVIECEGLYKIGWARSSPRLRRKTLQIGSPFELTLIGVIPGERIDEAEWHRVFAHKRVRGEWFKLTPEDISYILQDSYGVDRVPEGDDPA